MTGSSSRFPRAALVLPISVVAALGIACSGTETTPRTVRPVVVPEAEALLHPLDGYQWPIDPTVREAILDVWRRLEAGEDAQAEADVVRRHLAGQPQLQPAILVLAQHRLVAGDDQAVVDLLDPVVRANPGYTAAWVALGRAQERSGRLAEAYGAFRAAAPASAWAAGRAAELAADAEDRLLEDFDAALGRGRPEEAAGLLATLEEWIGPDAARVLAARLRLARARADDVEELAALRGLVDSATLELEDWIRLAELEVAVGDLREGVELTEDLLAEHPSNPRLERNLLRGQLAWRLQTAPGTVRPLADARVLTRAELAAVLYWLVPEIRYSPEEDPPIASDILDHPFRREILQVIDLDLIPIDAALHRFEPEVAASRADVQGALIRWLARQEIVPPCLEGVRELAGGTAPRGLVCSLASDCGLISTRADCLPETPASGAETLELLALTLERIAGPG